LYIFRKIAMQVVYVINSIRPVRQILVCTCIMFAFDSSVKELSNKLRARDLASKEIKYLLSFID
jgi:hypothetical protein